MALQDIEIDPDNNSFFITLVKNTYTDTVFSSVREIIINGIDSSIQAQSNKKTLVRYAGNALHVRDFGLGMSILDIRNVYGVVFRSKKKNDKNTTGSYGIGSKSPLSYCNFYNFKAYKDGICNEIVVVNHNGSMKYEVIATYKTSEENGVDITIPLEKKWLQSIYNYIISINEKYIDFSISDKELEYTILENYKRQFNTESYSGYITAIDNSPHVRPSIDFQSCYLDKSNRCLLKVKNTVIESPYTYINIHQYNQDMFANTAPDNKFIFDIDKFIEDNSIDENIVMSTSRESLIDKSDKFKKIIFDILNLEFNLTVEEKRKEYVNTLLNNSISYNLVEADTKFFSRKNLNLDTYLDGMYLDYMKSIISEYKEYTETLNDEDKSKLEHVEKIRELFFNSSNTHLKNNKMFIHLYQSSNDTVEKNKKFSINLRSYYLSFYNNGLLKDNKLTIALRDKTAVKKYLVDNPNAFCFDCGDYKTVNDFYNKFPVLKELSEIYEVKLLSELPAKPRKRTVTKRVTIDTYDPSKNINGLENYKSIKEVVDHAQNLGIPRQNIFFYDKNLMKTIYENGSLKYTFDARFTRCGIKIDDGKQYLNIVEKSPSNYIGIGYTSYKLSAVTKKYIESEFNLISSKEEYDKLMDMIISNYDSIVSSIKKVYSKEISLITYFTHCRYSIRETLETLVEYIYDIDTTNSKYKFQFNSGYSVTNNLRSYKDKIKDEHDIALLETDISDIIEEIEKTCDEEYIKNLMSIYKLDRESTREMMKSLPDKYMTLIENVSNLILPLKDNVEKILEYKSFV